eukprot:g818.t1
MFFKQCAFERRQSPSSLLKNAKKLHAKALKKRDKASITLLRKSLAKFECAILSGLDDDDSLVDAQTKKGDCLFHLGQRVLSNIETRPFDELNLSLYKDALTDVCKHFQSAVESYKQTIKSYGEWDLDIIAAVNCGNTLSTWAEYCEKEESIPLLQGALQCHRRALEADRGDLEVQLHLSDVLIQLAEAFGDVNRREDSVCTFKEAMRSFEHAYQQWTENEGSRNCDLTELLLRWGIGCITASEQSLDQEMKLMYSEKALKLLRQSIEADPNNAEAFNSLGHALVASAEICPVQETKQYLQQALHEGYEVAKRLIKHNNDATLGIADVHLLLGKVHLKDGDDVTAKTHFWTSIHYYEKLLKNRSIVGGFYGHSETLYNYACCCALAGKESSSKVALELLLKKQGTSVLEISTDKDLRVLSQYQWFQELVNKASSTMTTILGG